MKWTGERDVWKEQSEEERGTWETSRSSSESKIGPRPRRVGISPLSSHLRNLKMSTSNIISKRRKYVLAPSHLSLPIRVLERGHTTPSIEN